MNMEFSILDLRPCPHRDAPGAAFYLDLNLNQIIDRINALWGSSVKSFYQYFPLDEECEAYRRAVFGDVKRPGAYELFCRFVESAKEMEEAGKQKRSVDNPLQENVWQLREIDAYCRTFDDLYEGMKGLSLQSEGMQTFQSLLREYLESGEYQTMRKQVRELLQELAGFRFVITYEKDRMVIGEGTVPGEYEDSIRRCGDGEGKPFHNPFRANPNLTDLERECLDILVRKRPELFCSIRERAGAFQNYGNAAVLRFLGEIPFYLSFYRFEREMQEKGYLFAAPAVDPGKKLEARGLYDLALACVAVRENREVVSNSMEYGEGESFFVLTGPNQGGKTTFARSLGQLIYFTKLGLDVPAQAANVHYFSDILTHFSVEESVETGRGKLKEELIRLAPMMEENCRNAFVIINELFTTAATYDARIMGRKVLEHFIGQGCRGIYVTHLKELASVHPRIVSLRAMLNEERLQSFRIARSEAEESACAINQVNKYRLTYEQLKERL